MSSVYLRTAGLVCAGLILAGCAARKTASITEAQPEPPAKPMVCTPARPGDPMIGTWYSTSRPRGVSGDFQALTVLSADGTMRYETQLKIGRRTRPALRESGCWSVADGIYTQQTTQSNGEPVDGSDPIYRNRYRIEKLDQKQVTLRELKQGGQVVVARRMQPGYRLP